MRHALAEEFFLSRILRPHILEGEAGLRLPAQGRDHVTIADADAVLRVSIPVYVPAKGCQYRIPAFPVDRLTIHKNAIEVEQYCFVTH
jgi:hypothetical protein